MDAIHARFLPLLLLASACTDYSLRAETRRDVFRQDPRRQVDLLFVVDNSRSMAEEQVHLADSFSELLEPLLSADVDWRVAVTTTETQYASVAGRLEGFTDELILEDLDGVEIDRVSWTDVAWSPFVSMQLDAERFDAQLNDSADSWCASAEPFSGGMGSPGSWNPPCDGGLIGAPGDAPDQGVRAPEPGDLVFSEIMALTDGQDDACEWFELSNLSPDSLDLSDLTVRDDGGNLATFDADAVIGAGQAAVVSLNPGAEGDCAVPVDLVLSGSMSLADGLLYVDAAQPDAETRFRELVSVGTGSYGLEMGLEAAVMALEEAASTEGGFLREDAGLTVVVVSDEDDLSPDPVADYVNALAALKGDAGLRVAGTFQIAAVVGTEPEAAPDPACSADGIPLEGRRYMRAAEATGGITRSICGSFDDVAVSLGLTASGLQTRFALSDLPAPGRLDVYLYPSGDEDEAPVTLQEGEDYTLSLKQQADGGWQMSVAFALDQPPPASSALSVSYVLLPSGTDVEATYGDIIE